MNSTIEGQLPGTSEISEALYVVGLDYGLVWTADEQVVIARWLRGVTVTASRRRARLTTPNEIKEAFARFGVKPPPRGYAKDVVSRLGRLYGPRISHA